MTKHIIYIGNCTEVLATLPEKSIDLIITSPPYFNAPFDYEGLFHSYHVFLQLLFNFSKFSYNCLKSGAIAAINVDDMLINKIKYPIISDTIKIFKQNNFEYKGKIIWKKPEGYIRISRRSGVFLQHPFPMYYYPDNLLEVILLFQKPGLAISVDTTHSDNDIWEITNVLPIKGRLESKIAAFPEELPEKLLELFTKPDDTVCDPFLGSGTSVKVARDEKRNSIGIEIIEDLLPVIRRKTGFIQGQLLNFASNRNKDELFIKKLDVSYKKELSTSNDFKSNFSEIIVKEFNKANNLDLYQLLILDLRQLLQINFEKALNVHLEELEYGRIAIVFIASEHTRSQAPSLPDIMDFFFSKGLRYRDKIVVHHKSSEKWEILAPNSKRTVFNHCYYEIYIMQKGIFDYKAVEASKKQANQINLELFQKERWFLSYWDLRMIDQAECAYIALSRLIQLFSFHGDSIRTNIPNFVSKDRRLTIKLIDLA